MATANDLLAPLNNELLRVVQSILDREAALREDLNKAKLHNATLQGALEIEQEYRKRAEKLHDDWLREWKAENKQQHPMTDLLASAYNAIHEQRKYAQTLSSEIAKLRAELESSQKNNAQLKETAQEARLATADRIIAPEQAVAGPSDENIAHAVQKRAEELLTQENMRSQKDCLEAKEVLKQTEAELSKLEADRNTLQEELAEAHDSLQTQYDELQHVQAELEKTRQQLQDPGHGQTGVPDVEKLRQELTSVQEVRDRLSTSLALVQNEAAQQESRRLVREKEFDEIREKFQLQSIELRALRQELSLAQRDRGEFSMSLSAVGQVMKQQGCDVQKRLEEVNADLHGRTDELQAAKLELDKLRQDLLRVQGEHNTSSESLQRAKDVISEQERQSITSREMIHKKGLEIEELRKQLEAVRSDRRGIDPSFSESRGEEPGVGVQVAENSIQFTRGEPPSGGQKNKNKMQAVVQASNDSGPPVEKSPTSPACPAMLSKAGGDTSPNTKSDATKKYQPPELILPLQMWAIGLEIHKSTEQRRYSLVLRNHMLLVESANSNEIAFVHEFPTNKSFESFKYAQLQNPVRLIQFQTRAEAVGNAPSFKPGSVGLQGLVTFNFSTVSPLWTTADYRSLVLSLQRYIHSAERLDAFQTTKCWEQVERGCELRKLVASPSKGGPSPISPQQRTGDAQSISAHKGDPVSSPGTSTSRLKSTSLSSRKEGMITRVDIDPTALTSTPAGSPVKRQKEAEIPGHTDDSSMSYNDINAEEDQLMDFEHDISTDPAELESSAVVQPDTSQEILQEPPIEGATTEPSASTPAMGLSPRKRPMVTQISTNDTSSSSSEVRQMIQHTVSEPQDNLHSPISASSSTIFEDGIPVKKRRNKERYGRIDVFSDSSFQPTDSTSSQASSRTSSVRAPSPPRKRRDTEPVPKPPKPVASMSQSVSAKSISAAHMPSKSTAPVNEKDVTFIHDTDSEPSDGEEFVTSVLASPKKKATERPKPGPAHKSSSQIKSGGSQNPNAQSASSATRDVKGKSREMPAPSSTQPSSSLKRKREDTDMRSTASSSKGPSASQPVRSGNVSSLSGPSRPRPKPKRKTFPSQAAASGLDVRKQFPWAP